MLQVSTGFILQIIHVWSVYHLVSTDTRTRGKLKVKLAKKGAKDKGWLSLGFNTFRHLLGLCGLQCFSPDSNNLLIEISDLQPHYSLEEPCSIVAAREVRKFQHLLSDFSIEFGGEVAQMAFYINKLIQSVKLTIHLQHRDLSQTTVADLWGKSKEMVHYPQHSVFYVSSNQYLLQWSMFSCRGLCWLCPFCIFGSDTLCYKLLLLIAHNTNFDFFHSYLGL